MGTIKHEVLDVYGLHGAVCEPVLMGNLNTTWKAHHEGRVWIVQRLNPLFSPLIHEDIEAVTAYLAAHGLVTPRLLRTHAGALWHTDEKGAVWRVQTCIDGRVLQSAVDPSLCAAAASLVGVFHAVLCGMQYDFHAVRTGVHDTYKHVANMQKALIEHSRHVAFKEVYPIAQDLMARLNALPSLPSLPKRIVHGDLKFNNIVFDAQQNKAVALIDLDTLAHMPWPLEMGDALRSWCNPVGENSTETFFDIQRFESAIQGYGAWDLWTADEKEMLVTCVERITLTLAVRFAADALQESYFGYDAQRFEKPWMHHLERAKGQYALAVSVAEQTKALASVFRSYA